MVRLLLSCGANPNSVNTTLKNTPLMGCLAHYPLQTSSKTRGDEYRYNTRDRIIFMLLAMGSKTSMRNAAGAQARNFKMSASTYYKLQGPLRDGLSDEDMSHWKRRVARERDHNGLLGMLHVNKKPVALIRHIGKKGATSKDVQDSRNSTVPTSTSKLSSSRSSSSTAFSSSTPLYVVTTSTTTLNNEHYFLKVLSKWKPAS